jgi:phosphomevalonate kinase
MGLEPRISSLAQLPPFSPLPRPIQSTNKTGLGSSAALVTSLTAALLSHLGIVTPETTSSSDLHTAPNNGQTTSDSDIIHSLAQFAHCLAQGKVGSGFDVSSAVYGSHIYRRFSPSILTPLMDRPPPDAGPASASTSTSSSTSTRNAESLLHHLDPSRWDSQARPFRLPKGLRLVLADVDAGTDTPSFVGKVLEWRKRESAEALRLWTGLDESNRRLEGVLAELCGMEGSGGLEEAADKAIAEVSAEPHLGFGSSCHGPCHLKSYNEAGLRRSLMARKTCTERFKMLNLLWR